MTALSNVKLQKTPCSNGNSLTSTLAIICAAGSLNLNDVEVVKPILPRRKAKTNRLHPPDL